MSVLASSVVICTSRKSRVPPARHKCNLSSKSALFISHSPHLHTYKSMHAFEISQAIYEIQMISPRVLT